MAKHIKDITQIKAVGAKPKIINEIFGLVNTNTKDISIAHMKSPKGWYEPFQTPEFDEYTYVLSGELYVNDSKKIIIVRKGEAIQCKKYEKIRYSTPSMDTEYIAICLPAFSPKTVHREEE